MICLSRQPLDRTAPPQEINHTTWESTYSYEYCCVVLRDMFWGSSKKCASHILRYDESDAILTNPISSTFLLLIQQQQQYLYVLTVRPTTVGSPSTVDKISRILAPIEKVLPPPPAPPKMSGTMHRCASNQEASKSLPSLSSSFPSRCWCCRWCCRSPKNRETVLLL